MKAIFTVYKHTAPNGKVYIGITSKNVKTRWCNGKGYPNNKHFSNAIAKYGWNNFTHEILFTELTKAEACKIEIDLIASHKSNDSRYGYNRGSGGEFALEGVPRTKEWGKRISESRLGEKHHFFGKKHNEDTRKKMSESNKGKHNIHLTNEKKRKPVLQMTLAGDVLQQYPSAAEAERQNNCKHIADVCNGKRSHSAGYKWGYV